MLAVGPDELLSKATRYLEEVLQVSGVTGWGGVGWGGGQSRSSCLLLAVEPDELLSKVTQSWRKWCRPVC
jgi:hypothetical protein